MWFQRRPVGTRVTLLSGNRSPLPALPSIPLKGDPTSQQNDEAPRRGASFNGARLS